MDQRSLDSRSNLRLQLYSELQVAVTCDKFSTVLFSYYVQFGKQKI